MLPASLTGKEYAKLMEFLDRWNNVPEPHPTGEPTPTHLTFPQPINELRTALPETLPKGGK